MAALAAPTARARTVGWVIAACVLYAAIVIPIGIHKGGDFTAEVAQGDRLLRGAPLMTGSDANLGIPWPPFAALFLVPFAAIARMSLPLAKGCWALLGVICVGWSFATALKWTTHRTALLALAAIAVPLQTNFEHLQINPVLLALLMAAAADLSSERESRGGMWVGIATALKAFPGLVLLYLAYRRRWRAFAVGAGTAAGLTLVPLLRYGPAGGVDTVRQWLDLAVRERWTVEPESNQSLAALVTRLSGGTVVAVALAALLLAIVGIALHRSATRRPLREIGAVTLVAVLLSPIAWVHYFVLAFPAWLAVMPVVKPVVGGRWSVRNLPWAVAATVLAGVATSGVLTLGDRAHRVAVLNASPYTWGALLLLGLLLLEPSTPEENPRP